MWIVGYNEQNLGHSFRCTALHSIASICLDLDQNNKLQEKLNSLVDNLLKGNYHPLEIRLILDDAQNTMLGTITQMIQDVMQDPSRTEEMLRIMMAGTNRCDQEFLK